MMLWLPPLFEMCVREVGVLQQSFLSFSGHSLPKDKSTSGFSLFFFPSTLPLLPIIHSEKFYFGLDHNFKNDKLLKWEITQMMWFHRHYPFRSIAATGRFRFTFSLLSLKNRGNKNILYWSQKNTQIKHCKCKYGQKWIKQIQREVSLQTWQGSPREEINHIFI